MHYCRSLRSSAKAQGRDSVEVFQIEKLRFVFHSSPRYRASSSNRESRDIETGLGTPPWPDGRPSPPFLLVSLSPSFPTIQFFSAYSRQSRFLFFFVLSPLLFFLPSDGPESLHVLSSVRTAKSSGKSAERFALFWTRAAVSPFHSLSHHHHPRSVALSLAPISFAGPSPASFL